MSGLRLGWLVTRDRGFIERCLSLKYYISLHQQSRLDEVVALAALELIADAALAAPVLIVVDDLPWIDHSSREAIEFVARRIEHEPAVMLLSSRSAAVRADTETGAILKLDRLSDSASQQLIRDSSPSLSAVDERRILAAAAGNPLALLELPQTLGSSSRPEASPPTGFALTDRLERAFAVRSHDLRSETRSSLLVAALQDSDRVHESDDAIAQLSDGNKRTADFGDAVAAGLLSVDGQTFRFRHPLVRSAIADGASAEERRAVHVAFAASLSQDPDRSSWHRSLAATGQDAQLADELKPAPSVR